MVQVNGRDKAKREMGLLRYNASEYGDYAKDPVAMAAHRRDLLQGLSDCVRRRFGERGVWSLAEKWNCPLMWSHYAEQHKGLSLGYSTSESHFLGLRRVAYQLYGSRAVRAKDLYDWLKEKDEAALERILDSYYFHKAWPWKYEHEWRDVAPNAGSTASPAKLVSITFGLKCDRSVMNTVVKLFRDSDIGVVFYVIYTRDGGFRLQRRRVDHRTIQAEAIGHSQAFRDAELAQWFDAPVTDGITEGPTATVSEDARG